MNKNYKVSDWGNEIVLKYTPDETTNDYLAEFKYTLKRQFKDVNIKEFEVSDEEPFFLVETSFDFGNEDLRYIAVMLIFNIIWDSNKWWRVTNYDNWEFDNECGFDLEWALENINMYE